MRASLVAVAVGLTASWFPQQGSIATPETVRQPTIRVLTLEPADGSTVTRKTVVRVTFEYDVVTASPEGHELLVQFDTKVPKQTWGAHNFEIPARPGLSGVASIEFRLSEVWNERTLQRPFKVRLMLNKRRPDGGSNSIAVVPTITYFDK